ncbi:unnamed protein product [Closterium sp. Naga37s-1]|nr:unnamed protein product [Closterium sp. Naga37s-1]
MPSHAFTCLTNAHSIPPFHSFVRTLTETVRLDDDYNVFYSVITSTSDEAEPFGATIYQGAAGEAGTAVHNTVVAGETATWANLTRPPPPPPKGKKNKGTPPPPPPPKYTYGTNATWLKASTVSTIGGHTLKELVDAIIAKPDAYYVTFGTTDYESGAARGQFQSDPLPPPPKDKKDRKDGGKNGGGKNGGKNGGGKDGGKNGGGKNGGDKFGTFAGKPILQEDVSGTLASPTLAYPTTTLAARKHPPTVPPPVLPPLRAPYRPSLALLATRPLEMPPLTTKTLLTTSHSQTPAPPCPSLPLFATHHPLLNDPLPLPAPPCPSLPRLAPPCPSLPLLTTNATTNDYDI